MTGNINNDYGSFSISRQQRVLTSGSQHVRILHVCVSGELCVQLPAQLKNTEDGFIFNLPTLYAGLDILIGLSKICG